MFVWYCFMHEETKAGGWFGVESVVMKIKEQISN